MSSKSISGLIWGWTSWHQTSIAIFTSHTAFNKQKIMRTNKDWKQDPQNTQTMSSNVLITSTKTYHSQGNLTKRHEYGMHQLHLGDNRREQMIPLPELPLNTRTNLQKRGVVRGCLGLFNTPMKLLTLLTLGFCMFCFLSSFSRISEHS